MQSSFFMPHIILQDKPTKTNIYQPKTLFLEKKYTFTSKKLKNAMQILKIIITLHH